MGLDLGPMWIDTVQQKNSLITTDVDFEADGLQHGTLRIPHSHDRSAYGYIPVPLWKVKSGEGPTVLLTGANHGDEYEAPVAFMRLLHAGVFASVTGRVIVIPGLNFPAYRVGTRTSPIDRVNLNRAFPGKRDGTITEMLAHYIETELLPMADYVLDFHAGGASLNYLPTLVTFHPESEEERQKLDVVVKGFNPPREMVMDLSQEDRQIGAAARRSGALFLAGEFGGGATVSPAGVDIVAVGVIGALQALGMLAGEDRAAERTIPRLVVKPKEHYVYAPRAGIFEPLFVLGDQVEAGQKAGRLYDIDEPWREPVELFFAGSGLVICVRTLALVEPGDCLVHLADFVSPE